jgi:hypothetical protein
MEIGRGTSEAGTALKRVILGSNPAVASTIIWVDGLFLESGGQLYCWQAVLYPPEYLITYALLKT